MNYPAHHLAQLRVEVLDGQEALAAPAGAWKDLLASVEGHHMASSPLWLSTWWQVFGPLGGRRLQLACFWQGRDLVGIAPLVRRWRWDKSGLPFRCLELVGTGEDEQHEIATDYGGLIAAPSYERAVAQAFARAMAEDRFGTWDELSFRSLDATSPTCGQLDGALERNGLPVSRVALSGAPYIPLPRSFDEYLAALSSSARYFVRRSLRDFESFSGGRAEFKCASTEEELAEGQAVLVALHGERWESEGRSGVFASPYFRSFHQKLMPELLRRGQLDLRWVVLDGRPLAAIYNYVYAGRVHFYQAGRVPEIPNNVRPGIVLHVAAIKAAIAAGHREYDFLSGVSRYKQQLALAVRPMADLSVERPGLRRTLTRAARSWKTWVTSAHVWVASSVGAAAESLGAFGA